MNIALLTAGGTGSRMHRETPKQFIHVNDKPIIIYTLEQFQKHPSIDAIIVVVLDGWQQVLQDYVAGYGITKCRWIVKGGKTGQESIANGLKKLKQEGVKDDAVITIHDGNRPLVSQEIITDSLTVFGKYGSAIAAIPCIEAIFKSKDALKSDISIPREELFRTQTPHTYSFGKLMWAHEQAKVKGITNTAATCVLMNMLGERIYFSLGAEKNLKITMPEDLEIFKALLDT